MGKITASKETQQPAQPDPSTGTIFMLVNDVYYIDGDTGDVSLLSGISEIPTPELPVYDFMVDATITPDGITTFNTVADIGLELFDVHKNIYINNTVETVLIDWTLMLQTINVTINQSWTTKGLIALTHIDVDGGIWNIGDTDTTLPDCNILSLEIQIPALTTLDITGNLHNVSITGEGTFDLDGVVDNSYIYTILRITDNTTQVQYCTVDKTIESTGAPTIIGALVSYCLLNTVPFDTGISLLSGNYSNMVDGIQWPVKDIIVPEGYDILVDTDVIANGTDIFNTLGDIPLATYNTKDLLIYVGNSIEDTDIDFTGLTQLPTFDIHGILEIQAAILNVPLSYPLTMKNGSVLFSGPNTQYTLSIKFIYINILSLSDQTITFNEECIDSFISITNVGAIRCNDSMYSCTFDSDTEENVIVSCKIHECHFKNINVQVHSSAQLFSTHIEKGIIAWGGTPPHLIEMYHCVIDGVITSLEVDPTNSTNIMGGVQWPPITTLTDRATYEDITFSTVTETLTRTKASVYLTLEESPTITITDGIKGDNFTLHVIQDTTGTRIITWVNVEWGDSGEPTLSTSADAVDILTLIWDEVNTQWLGFVAGLGY